MTDKNQLSDAAKALIEAAMERAEATAEKAHPQVVAEVGTRADPFRPLIVWEMAGALAVDAVLHAAALGIHAASEPLEERGRHATQAIANTAAGGLATFVSDMQPGLRDAIIRNFLTILMTLLNRPDD